MDELRELYGSATGKTDSMYVYVLYNCHQDMIKNHVKKQLEIIDKVSDTFKKRLFSSRYYCLRDMIEQNPDDHCYNCTLFLGDTLKSHDLTKSQQQLLKDYSHQEISFVYKDKFDLDFVEDLLYNNNPYHVYRINNNKIDYLKLTKTKKVVVVSEESRTLDIKQFVSKTLPVGSRYVIYGVSSKLKGFVDELSYAVITRHVKDDELIDLIDQIDQEKLLIELDKDLEMIQDSKAMHRVVFKHDIPGKIKQGLLQKLYIDIRMYTKFIENAKKNDLDLNFKVITIDTSVKSFIEDREKKINTYGGVIGVTYY